MILKKKICQCIFAIFSKYLPLKKSGAYIWTNFNSFYPRLVEISLVVLEKKMKRWKVYDNNDDHGQRTNFDQKSTPEPKAQVSLKHV